MIQLHTEFHHRKKLVFKSEKKIYSALLKFMFKFREAAKNIKVNDNDIKKW